LASWLLVDHYHITNENLVTNVKITRHRIRLRNIHIRIYVYVYSVYTYIYAYTYLVHDDGAVNGQFQVSEGRLDDGEHFSHAVNLLAKEDVERLQVTHLLQSLTHLRAGTSQLVTV